MSLTKSQSVLGAMTLVALWSSVNCANSKAPIGVPTNDATKAADPNGALTNTDGTQGGTGTAGGIPAGASLIDATYSINATAVGMTACSGNLEVKVNGALAKTNSTQLFDIPQGSITCPLAGGKTIDIAQMLKSVQGSGAGGGAGIDVNNGVISVRSLGGSTYSPPRPLLPSFISSTKDQLAHLNLTRNVTLTAPDGKTDSGTTTVQMVSFDAPYQVPGLGRVFKHTLDFKVTNTGFKNTDKVTNALFDQMEFRISLDPIAILAITFDGTAGQYLDAQAKLGAAGGTGTGTDAAGGGALGSLPGGGDPLKALLSGNLVGAGVDLIVKGIASIIKVHLEVLLTAEQNLDTSANAKDTSPSIGEIINGHQTGN